MGDPRGNDAATPAFVTHPSNEYLKNSNLMNNSHLRSEEKQDTRPGDEKVKQKLRDLKSYSVKARNPAANNQTQPF